MMEISCSVAIISNYKLWPCWINVKILKGAEKKKNKTFKSQHSCWGKKKRDILPWFHAPHHVFYVLSNLIGGLQAKEVEVSQQVVVEGQELEVQLGQSQAAWEDKPVNVSKSTSTCQ